MPRGYRKFSQILDQAKEVILEHNLTFDEIEENTGVDADFLRILFDDTTKTSKNISEVFEFLKIRFVSKKLVFKPYVISSGGGQLKIKRIIKPVCQMYYDIGTDQFFKFSFKLKSYKPTETQVNLLKLDMKELIYRHLEENFINKS